MNCITESKIKKLMNEKLLSNAFKDSIFTQIGIYKLLDITYTPEINRRKCQTLMRSEATRKLVTKHIKIIEYYERNRKLI